jgi:hypothetical protein
VCHNSFAELSGWRCLATASLGFLLGQVFFQWIEGNSFTINQGVLAKREGGFRFQFSGTNPLMEQHTIVMGLGIALESWLWLVAMML